MPTELGLNCGQPPTFSEILGQPEDNTALTPKLSYVFDSMADFVVAEQGGQIPEAVAKVEIKSFHAGLNKGGGIFYRSTGKHNGGTFVVTSTAYPTDWDNEAQKATWFTEGSSNAAGWKRREEINITPTVFGAIPLPFGNYKYLRNDDWQDSTVELKALVKYANNTLNTLFLDNRYLIKDEILVEREINIAGKGKPNADDLESEQSYIFYDIKDPAKCCMRFSNSVVYRGYQHNLTGFGVINWNMKADGSIDDYANQPTNQHCFVFEKQFGYSIRGIEFIYVNGYAQFYTNGAYGQSLYQQDVTFRSCAGEIGQTIYTNNEGAGLIVSGIRLVDINTEWGENKTGQKPIKMDLRGFRELKMENVILENAQATASTVPLAFAANSHMEIKGIHREIVCRDNTEGPLVDVIIDETKYSPGDSSIYRFEGIGNLRFHSRLQEGSHGKIFIEKSNYYKAGGYEITDFISSDNNDLKEFVFIDNKMNLSKFSKTVDRFIDYYKGFFVNFNPNILGLYNARSGLPTYNNKMVLDNGISIEISNYKLNTAEIVNKDGKRCLKLTTTQANTAPSVVVRVPDNIGNIGISALIKYEGTAGTPRIGGNYYNRKSIDFKGKLNEWTWVHSFIETTPDTGATGVSALNPDGLTLYVACIIISDGMIERDLSIPENTQIDGKALSTPTSGDHIKGDRLISNDRTFSATCTASGNPGTWA